MRKFRKSKSDKGNVGPLGASYWKLWSATAISNLGDGVSMVAYPWLASAITRSPILIALAAVASRLPWLIFTLPAGVITDRFDRKKIIVAMDAARGFLTVFVAVMVYWKADSLPKLNDLTNLTDLKTNWPLYIVAITASFLFGCAEVLRDNTAQTFMPSVVKEEQLEKANGQMWSAESLTNSFIGPPLGSFLIAIAVFVPFFFDAASFFVAVALLSTITTITKPITNVDNTKPKVKPNFRAEIKEGFDWLWSHELLRPMAIILGSMNGISSLVGAAFILFAQEILHTSVLEFAILGTSGAIGGIIGGIYGPKIAKKIGSGPSLFLTLLIMPIFEIAIGFVSSWEVVWLLSGITTIFAVLWNVITVSLRQSIIPTHLLGRVNSVYRFFAWGTIPIGLLIGGGLITLMEHFTSREWALRTPYFVTGALGFIILAFAAPRLTTAKIEAARAQSK
ncbi:MAG: MFS transporter [Actinomycetes bacterium]